MKTEEIKKSKRPLDAKPLPVLRGFPRLIDVIITFLSTPYPLDQYPLSPLPEGRT